MRVSILVLLEIGLGAQTGQTQSAATHCFNPCFVGNRSGSVTGKLFYNASGEFQSLFCWKSVWEKLFYVSSELLNGFQSLFCWKSVWENRLRDKRRHQRVVSILVLLEIGLGVWYHFAIFGCVVLFQSLFCWKSVWEKMPSTVLLHLFNCFNPCFVGNRSGSEN